jgi:hypothetical protein
MRKHPASLSNVGAHSSKTLCEITRSRGFVGKALKEIA